ncbi:carbohydrate ABC transporter substrate-binding protein [Halobacteriales archaeon QH_2_65_14]|nr:MAG: carbohydrate ABC transporter substrate-binding protein [Halobacteriales archaeon QH_2_65_14]
MSENNRDLDRRTLLGSIGVSFVALAGCTGDDDDTTEDDEPGMSDDEGDASDGDTDAGEGDGNAGDSDGDSDGEGGGGVSGSIDVTGVWAGQEEENFRMVIDHVQSQTDVEIEYHPRTTDALLTGTLMDYESGTAPADIVVMPSPARIRSDARNGHLEPVGDVWDPANYAVEPDQVTVDGEVYAVPFKMDLKPGFWYRQSFFEEHGLSEPEDYDEFLDLLAEIDGIEGVDAPIASGNGDGWPLSDVTEGFFLRQENGDELQQGLISGEVDFTDERVQTAFEEIQQLHQEGYFSQQRDFGVQYEYFWDNQLPLYFMGSFTTGFDAIQEPEDLGVFMMPGAQGMVASVNWFTIPTYSDNVEAAKAALSEFISPEGQRVWAKQGGFIASSNQMSADAYQLEVMAQLPQMADQVTIVPDLDDALGNPFQQEFWSQLKGLWSDPDQDLSSIIERLDEVQDETLTHEE